MTEPRIRVPVGRPTEQEIVAKGFYGEENRQQQQDVTKDQVSFAVRKSVVSITPRAQPNTKIRYRLKVGGLVRRRSVRVPKAGDR